MQIYPVGA